MQILLRRMVQKNKASGRERRLRCCLESAGDLGVYSWEWQDERGHWNPYVAADAVEMEKALTDKKYLVDIDVAGVAHTVDTCALTQTDNDTGSVKRIRRYLLSEGKENPGSKTGNAVKSNTVVDGLCVRWEWEEEEGRWMAFAPEINQAVTDAYSGGYTELEYTVGGTTKMVIFLQKMLQKNAGTGQENRLRCCLKDDAESEFYSWEWEDQKEQWKSYSIQACVDLENTFSCGLSSFSVKAGRNSYTDSFTGLSSVSIKAARSSYTVDTDSLRQTNDVTGYVRRVRRSQSSAALPKLSEAAEIVISGPKSPASKLPQAVQDLINVICDVKAMEDMVQEMKYGSRKANIENLTAKQIQASYSALKRIDESIVNNNTGPSSSSQIRKNKEEVHKLLQLVNDIKTAMKILQPSTTDENPIDTHYRSLNCDLTPLERMSPDFKMIETYLDPSKIEQLKVMDIFIVHKEGEEKSFNNVGNRMLLWHGSRMTNWVEILCHGLCIAPEESRTNGTNFGKGVYFADMSVKSSTYCYANKSHNIGFMLLCEVALGKTHDLLQPLYDLYGLPAGKHSVRGLGQCAPDPKDTFTLPDGTIVPMGKGIATNLKKSTLGYNEYVVYNTNQIKMKYLIKMQISK